VKVGPRSEEQSGIFLPRSATVSSNPPPALTATVPSERPSGLPLIPTATPNPSPHHPQPITPNPTTPNPQPPTAQTPTLTQTPHPKPQTPHTEPNPKPQTLRPKPHHTGRHRPRLGPPGPRPLHRRHRRLERRRRPSRLKTRPAALPARPPRVVRAVRRRRRLAGGWERERELDDVELGVGGPGEAAGYGGLRAAGAWWVGGGRGLRSARAVGCVRLGGGLVCVAFWRRGGLQVALSCPLHTDACPLPLLPLPPTQLPPARAPNPSPTTPPPPHTPPKALHMLPGEILMAGSEPALHRYRFSLESAARVELGCASAFAIDVDAGSGTTVVGGARGCTLLSPYATRLGLLTV